MKKRIGSILIEMGFLDDDQLRMALMETKKTGAMLGEVLINLDWITDDSLQMAIAVQSGAKILNTDDIEIDPELLIKIPQDFVTTQAIFPFKLEGNVLKVATANPFDVVTKDKLSRMTGYQVETYIAAKEWISNAIVLYYETALKIDDAIENLTLTTTAASGKTDDNRIVNLCNLLIEKGYITEASDIHIIPDAKLVRIYYRIDGVLHQTFLFPISFHQSLVTRFKIMGEMDISNPNIPHDGRIKYSSKIGNFDLRVSSMPTQFGEAIVMRLLVYNQVVGSLEKLGFEKEDLEKFLKAIKLPYGLILSTGPTGSGKTTTLYTSLMAINSPSVNTITIEDPIEYVIPTIRQTPVNPKAGMTFGNALRSAMRQDPDIILVGEIRDKETADLAIRASITGHLVLSTLHTNDAASAINRLIDLGINSTNLSSSLVMVVAQRLMRKICPKCCTTEPITDEQIKLFEENGLDPPTNVKKPKGCDNCYFSGYRGRTGIYEIILNDREMEELICSGASHSKIEDVAVRAGTSLMIRQALKHVVSQTTSIEEVFRVVAYA